MSIDHGTCKGPNCGARVVFIPHHRTRKPMVFDAVETPEGEWQLTDNFLDGEMAIHMPGVTGPGYTPHHATCPDVDLFRRTTPNV